MIRLTIDGYGNKYWKHRGKSHRLKGPAAIYTDGSEVWFYKGLHHRVEGPAVIAPTWRQWYYFGRLHRLDGPAVEFFDGMGENQYYIGGKKLSPEEFAIATSNLSEKSKTAVIDMIKI